MVFIENGFGGRHVAKVDESGRLFTFAVTTDEADDATKTGRSFNINTGPITLTNAVNTPVLYMKNNEDEDIHITAFAIGLGTSTGGTATIPVKITIIRNPTAGTIVSSPVAVDMNGNRNYGSNIALDVDAYKGATGKTMTGGSDHILFFQPDFGRLFATIDEVLPKGTSIGVKIEPPTSNTSLETYVALICHKEAE